MDINRFDTDSAQQAPHLLEIRSQPTTGFPVLSAHPTLLTELMRYLLATDEEKLKEPGPLRYPE